VLIKIIKRKAISNNNQVLRRAVEFRMFSYFSSLSLRTIPYV